MASADFVDGIQHDFKMGTVLPRQNTLQAFQGALGGVRAAAVRAGLSHPWTGTQRGPVGDSDANTDTDHAI